MVYTLTLNPSLDYMMPVRQLRTGATNRSEGEQIRIGGKGINVSILLRRLGVENLALGIAAGFTGEELLRRMDEKGIRHAFLMGGAGFTRINVKLLSEKEKECAVYEAAEIQKAKDTAEVIVTEAVKEAQRYADGLKKQSAEKLSEAVGIVKDTLLK